MHLSRVLSEPVTTMRTAYSVGSQAVDTVTPVVTPGTTSLGWTPGAWVIDPVTGLAVWQRGGYAWSMVTDHSRGLEVASGLDAEGLRLQRRRIDRWNARSGDDHEPGLVALVVLDVLDQDVESVALEQSAELPATGGVGPAVISGDLAFFADWVDGLKAIDEAGVAIVLIDAREGLTDQDLHLIGLAQHRGRALVIGINKWDGMSLPARRRVEHEIDRQLEFVAFADRRYLSALHGSGIAEVVESALKAYESAGRQVSTPRLNEILQEATTTHPPPIVRGRRIRLRYAHQGGRYPPLIVIHGSQAERVPARYKRYLENSFRKALRLVGTPIRIEFRSGENPFAGRRNQLTPRQVRRRKRVIRHSR